MAIAHRPPDQAPCDDELFVDCRQRFEEEGMPRDVSEADYFGFDIAHLYLDASPRLPERVIEETDEKITYVSKWGYSAVKWKNKSGALHYFDPVSQTRDGWDRVKRRLMLDIDATGRISKESYFTPFYAYPTWKQAVSEYEELRSTGRYVLLGFYGPFEATWRHHGYVESLIAFLQDPDWLQDMVSTYTDLICDVIQKGLALGIRPDGAYLIEDLGTTHGPLMAPEAFRRILKPCYAKIFDVARKNGMNRFMHSDGRIHGLMDELMDTGLEAFNPIDTGSGMDLVDLRKRYGTRLTLYGGVSGRNMHDERLSNAEIDEKVAFASRNGGYIYHSDHSVPPTVSLARYQEILKRVRAVTRPSTIR